MKSLIRLIGLLILVQSAPADQFKVTTPSMDSGKDVIVNAETSDDARYIVKNMIPGAVVTGVRTVK